MTPQTYFGIDNDENAWLLVQRNEVKTVFFYSDIFYIKKIMAWYLRLIFQYLMPKFNCVVI